MSSFALLWGKILHSSIWANENQATRLVWITMLAMKDVNGIVESSIPGLREAAKVTDEEVREALRVLLSEDPEDSSKVDGGRRIRVVPGGWQIVNNDLYRFSTEARREIWRQSKAEQRRKQEASQAKRKKKKGPLPGETAHAAAEEAGASAAQLDALSAPVTVAPVEKGVSDDAPAA